MAATAMAGGGGADIFVFGEGHDRIVGFSLEADKLDLGAIGFAQVLAAASDDGDGVLIDFGANDLKLYGIALADLEEGLLV